MRVLIFGAGSMACLFGARLAPGGRCHSHRPLEGRHRRDPGTWNPAEDAGACRRTVSVRAEYLGTPLDPFDLAFVLVKSWQTGLFPNSCRLSKTRRHCDFAAKRPRQCGAARGESVSGHNGRRRNIAWAGTGESRRLGADTHSGALVGGRSIEERRIRSVRLRCQQSRQPAMGQAFCKLRHQCTDSFVAHTQRRAFKEGGSN